MDRAVPAVYDFGDAVMLSLSRALGDLMAFIPKLLGALLLLFVGWIISRALEALVTRGLRMIRFNQIADRAEIDQFLARAGVRMDPASVVGKMVYWFVMLSFVLSAFGALGLGQVEGLLTQIVGFIPNVIVALVVLLLGALAANFVANLVRGSVATARVGSPDLLANIARGAILVFAVIMAMDQLEIAPTIINTLWMALVGMFAVAGALAFGLGGRDLAGRLLEDWYNRGREKAQDVKQAVQDTRYSTPPAATPTTPTSGMDQRRAA